MAQTDYKYSDDSAKIMAALLPDLAPDAILSLLQSVSQKLSGEIQAEKSRNDEQDQTLSQQANTLANIQQAITNLQNSVANALANNEALGDGERQELTQIINDAISALDLGAEAFNLYIGGQKVVNQEILQQLIAVQQNRCIGGENTAFGPDGDVSAMRLHFANNTSKDVTVAIDDSAEAGYRVYNCSYDVNETGVVAAVVMKRKFVNTTIAGITTSFPRGNCELINTLVLKNVKITLVEDAPVDGGGDGGVL